jgi:hypothetical protein
MSAICQAANAATTYDVVRDFTTKANPNGVWSYTDDNGPLAHSSRRYQGVKGLDNWSNDVTTGGLNVTIVRNMTGAPVTLYDGVLTLPANYLMLSPQDNQADAFVVFTAPTAGTYTLNGNFTGLDNPEGHRAEALIVEDGNKYLFGQYVRFGVKRRFHFTLSLAAGDTLAFQCVGDNLKNRHDIGVTAKIVGP